MFSIGGFDIIVSGVIDTTRVADGLSTVGVFAYWCPGVARFRAPWRGAAGMYDGAAGTDWGVAVP